MKTIFIINPKAGQGKSSQKLLTAIKEKIHNSDADVYVTKSSGDAMEFAKKYCKEHGAARFIACGGDGTLGEVINAVAESGASEVGVMPVGTGNDFCRNFGSGCDFGSVELQMSSESQKCDVIKCTLDSGERVIYSANMINIGFDCNVADMCSKMKQKPFISGSMAYFLSIFVMLIKKKGANLKIEVDGELCHRGSLLLTSVANGAYCGGGIMSNPMASVMDSDIDINIIKDISRFRFLGLLPYYMKGTHNDIKGIEKIITTRKCKKIKMASQSGEMRLSIDGEIVSAQNVEFEIIPGAISFIVPQKDKKIKEKEIVI